MRLMSTDGTHRTASRVLIELVCDSTRLHATPFNPIRTEASLDLANTATMRRTTFRTFAQQLLFVFSRLSNSCSVASSPDRSHLPSPVSLECAFSTTVSTACQSPRREATDLLKIHSFFPKIHSLEAGPRQKASRAQRNAIEF